jgi:hypothetical protein
MLAVIAIRTIEHNYTAQQLWHRARVPDPKHQEPHKPAKHPSSTFHSTSFSCERIISPIISAHASSSLFCAVASEHSSHSKQPHTGCPRCTVTECDRAVHPTPPRQLRRRVRSRHATGSGPRAQTLAYSSCHAQQSAVRSPSAAMRACRLGDVVTSRAAP